MMSSLTNWWSPPAKTFKKTDVERSIPEVIESRGFKCQQFEVTTDDGYILTLFRIINPKYEHLLYDKHMNINIHMNDKHDKHMKPILLMHGFGGNASQFLTTSDDGYLKDSIDADISDQDNNLGFYLSKRRYDVWMGHMRGGRYSLKHVKYDIESDDFWNFSIDQLIKYDLKNSIDYILNVTNQDMIGYVGVSLGTTLMFGLLSEYHEYNHKISPFISLAPCWRLSNMRSPLKYPLKWLSNYWNKYPRLKPEFSLKTELNFHEYLRKYPVKNMFQSYFAYVFMGLLGGYNPQQFDFSRLCVYAAHSASLWWPWKQLIHSSQYICRNIPLSKFDFGKDQNMNIYGMETPPIYDVSNISNVDIALFYSKNDWACAVEDVNHLKDQLKGALINFFH